jgi:two-component sensor histidine kinase
MVRQAVGIQRAADEIARSASVDRERALQTEIAKPHIEVIVELRMFFSEVTSNRGFHAYRMPRGLIDVTLKRTITSVPNKRY